MKNFKKYLKLLLIPIFVFTSFKIYSNKSFACSCMIPPSVRERFESNKTVLTGKVISIENYNRTEFPELKVKLEVNKVWKGEKNKEISLITNSSSAACGIDFEINKEYLIYTNSDKVHLCSGTGLVEYAKEDLMQLELIKPAESAEAIKEPLMHPNPHKKTSFNLKIILEISAIIIFLTLLGVYVYKTKKKKK